MPISFSAANNKITVTGGSESSPCTFADLYAEDVSNGWNVVVQANPAMYTVACHIDVGDGTPANETWFVSEDEAVYFADEIRFEVLGHAHVRLGEEVDGYSRKGVYWNISGWTSANSSSIYLMNAANASFEMYSSHIHNRHYGIYGWARGTIVFKNSILSMSYGYECTSWTTIWSFASLSSGIVEDLFVTHTGAVSLSSPNMSFKNFHFHKGSQFGDAYPGAVIMENFFTTGVTKAARLTLTALAQQLYLDNPLVDVAASAIEIHFPESFVMIRYSINIMIVDGDNRPIPNAEVRMVDRDGETNDDRGFSWVTTDGDGRIPEQKVATVKYQGSGVPASPAETVHTPHTIVVKANGYRTYTKTLTLDKAVNETIRLYKQIPVCVQGTSLAVNTHPADPENVIYV